jgi:hypothetical protein
MKHFVVQMLGAGLMVVSVLGAGRLLMDHENVAPMGWVPGGLAGRLTAYAALIAAGALLEDWGQKKAKKARAN